VAVKIHCAACDTYYHVEGPPVRGRFKVQTTLSVDWQAMNDVERVHLQTRWFYQCPRGCEGRLTYYTASLAAEMAPAD
jgi:hypothetical protein